MNKTSFATVGLMACRLFAASAGCSSSDDTQHSDIAAITLDSGSFGALLVTTSGELLAPIVARDTSGALTKITGVQWTSTDGTAAAVLVDDRGMPTQAILGDFILVYSNWDTTAETVDVAKVFGPGKYVEVFKHIHVPGSSALAANAMDASRGATPVHFASDPIVTQSTCLPNCGSDKKNLAEILRIVALDAELALCMEAVPVSLGAAALPCAGAVASAAGLLGDEKWLQDHESVYWGLKASGCAAEISHGDPRSCLTAAMDLLGTILAYEHKTSNADASLLADANKALGDPTKSSGIVDPGTGLPKCSGDYQCTPGAYLPCYPEGVKQCSDTCTWGPCPRFELGCGPPPGGCPAGEHLSQFGNGCCETGACPAGGNFGACTNVCDSWYEYAGSLYGPCKTGFNSSGGGEPDPGFYACVDRAAHALDTACDPPPSP